MRGAIFLIKGINKKRRGRFHSFLPQVLDKESFSMKHFFKRWNEVNGLEKMVGFPILQIPASLKDSVRNLLQQNE